MGKEPSERSSGWSRNNSPETTFKIREFNDQVHLVNGRGEVYTIDPMGSLSTLALGAQGYRAWKMAKAKHEK